MAEGIVLHQPDSPETDAARVQWFERWATGPIRTRWESLPPQQGDPAPDLELVEARSGRPTRLSSTWAAGPALLLFWRHFGCGCGRDRSTRLTAEIDGYRAAGAKTIALIGQGEAERARVYAAANRLPADVLLFCDPEERAYAAYGLLEVGTPEIFFDAPDEFLVCDQGAGAAIAQQRLERGMPVVDNTWLMPGDFVVDGRGILRLTYRYQFCENWIDPRVTNAHLRFATGELSIPR